MCRVPPGAFLKVFAIAWAAALLVATSATGAPTPAPGADAAEIVAAGPTAPGETASWVATFTRGINARVAPRERAKIVTKVERLTAFWRRTQRLMVVSAAETDPATGRQWVKVRLPGRPNGSEGWVPVDRVRLSVERHRIVVDVGDRTVEVFTAGRRVARFRAGVGTGSTPTPLGLFAVQDPVPSDSTNRSYLGPYIITLTAYSEVLTSFMGGNGLVALHGTNAPGLLGQAVSHGCVRLTNGAVTKLYKVAAPGTPVVIQA